MSRSFKKTPVEPRTGAESEKEDKRRAHQTLRTHFRTAVQSTTDLEELQFDESNKAHSDRRGYCKDGKPLSGVRVKRIGRSVQVLAAPERLRSLREVHKVLAK